MKEMESITRSGESEAPFTLELNIKAGRRGAR
jgi:hypothetical protein